MVYDDNAVVHGHGRRLDIQNMHDCDRLLLVEDRNRFLQHFTIISDLNVNVYTSSSYSHRVLLRCDGFLVTYILQNSLHVPCNCFDFRWTRLNLCSSLALVRMKNRDILRVEVHRTSIDKLLKTDKLADPLLLFIRH
jgi:hypothetical protein